MNNSQVRGINESLIIKYVQRLAGCLLQCIGEYFTGRSPRNVFLVYVKYIKKGYNIDINLEREAEREKNMRPLSFTSEHDST